MPNEAPPTWDETEAIPDWESTVPIEDAPLTTSPSVASMRAGYETVPEEPPVMPTPEGVPEFEGNPAYQVQEGVDDMVVHPTKEPILSPSVVRTFGTRPVAKAASLIPGTPGKIARGLVTGTEEAVSGFTTPESLGMLPAFALPVAGQALALYLGTKGGAEGIKEVKNAIDSGDTERAAKAIPGLMISALMLHGGAKGIKNLAAPKGKLEVAQRLSLEKELPEVQAEFQRLWPERTRTAFRDNGPAFQQTLQQARTNVREGTGRPVANLPPIVPPVHAPQREEPVAEVPITPTEIGGPSATVPIGESTSLPVEVPPEGGAEVGGRIPEPRQAPEAQAEVETQAIPEAQSPRVLLSPEDQAAAQSELNAELRQSETQAEVLPPKELLVPVRETQPAAPDVSEPVRAKNAQTETVIPKPSAELMTPEETGELSELRKKDLTEDGLSEAETQRMFYLENKQTRVKRSTQTAKEAGLLRDAGVIIPDDFFNPSEGVENHITGWTRDSNGFIQIRVESHTSASMSPRLVTLKPGDTLTHGMNDSVSGTTRYRESNPEPIAPEKAQGEKSRAIAQIESELENKYLTPSMKAEIASRKSVVEKAVASGKRYEPYKQSTYGGLQWAIADAETGTKAEAPLIIDHPERGRIETTRNNFKTKSEATKAASEIESRMARAREQAALRSNNLPEGRTPASKTAPVSETVKEPWMMTKAEWSSTIKKEYGRQGFPDLKAKQQTDATHRAEVEKAIAEGKPVPTEVLRDYPDLAKPSIPAEELKGEAQVTPESVKSEVKSQFSIQKRGSGESAYFQVVDANGKDVGRFGSQKLAQEHVGSIIGKDKSFPERTGEVEKTETEWFSQFRSAGKELSESATAKKSPMQKIIGDAKALFHSLIQAVPDRWVLQGTFTPRKPLSEIQRRALGDFVKGLSDKHPQFKDASSMLDALQPKAEWLGGKGEVGQTMTGASAGMIGSFPAIKISPKGVPSRVLVHEVSHLFYEMMPKDFRTAWESLFDTDSIAEIYRRQGGKNAQVLQGLKRLDDQYKSAGMKAAPTEMFAIALEQADALRKTGKLSEPSVSYYIKPDKGLIESVQELFKKETTKSTQPEPPESKPAPGVAKEETPTSPGFTPVEGPGARGAGGPRYSAIQQLTDQINTAPPVGTRAKLSWREKMADQWAQGKTAFEKAVAAGRAVKQSFKDTLKGVRDVTDIDRRVGELDWALQQSSAQSRNLGKAMEKQIKNQTMREAAAIWNDTPGIDDARKAAITASMRGAPKADIESAINLEDVAEKQRKINDAVTNLPATTKPNVRRALEMAARAEPEMQDFADQLKQYYGIRADDAQTSDIFENALEDYYTHVWEKPENMPDSLRGAISNGKVSTYFQFARERKIPTFIEGILDGKTPVLDPAKVVPYYNYALDRAIASRQFIEELSNIDVKEGVDPVTGAPITRPLVAVSGSRQELTSGANPSLLIRPQRLNKEVADYRAIEHPAMRRWKWADTDPATGKNTLYQGELYVHPKYYTRLANMLDRGRLTPAPATRAFLKASGEVKGFKLGLFSLFHDVHVASHAAWHWTNPLKEIRSGPIDWESPDTQFAVEKMHLKLAPDPAELKLAEEGVTGGSPLIHKFPIFGPLSRIHSEWLFTQFIPKLKLRTAMNAYDRNIWARDHLPGAVSGLKGLTDEQVAARVGDSVNNAFGELNQLFLGKNGRNPTTQRLLRGLFLAPDFGEARARFAGKAITKAGLEERIAMLTMGITMYAAARIANWESHGDPEMGFENAFRVKVGDSWWSMRSVAGDVVHALKDFGQFAYVRLNPLYSRTVFDAIGGRDVRTGQKLSALDKFVTRPAEQVVPISLSGLTRYDKNLWDSFWQSMGVQKHRETPLQATRRMLVDYKEKSKDPKIVADVERMKKEVNAPSEYRDLDLALEFDHFDDAKKVIEKLRLTHPDNVIFNRMNPWNSNGDRRPLFHDSRKLEMMFKRSLPEKEKAIYDRALTDRVTHYRKFQSLWKERPSK